MALLQAFSKGEVNRAGDLLREWWMRGTPYRPGDAIPDDWAGAVNVLFGYRESFQGPLKKTTVGVRQFVERETSGDIIVGQRLKRAPQIVKKLSRFPGMKLARMQDIGGCRAILEGADREVQGVLRRIRKNWEIKGLKDYVTHPAPSGYRAIHVIVMRDGHLIEIQLRTPRQHEWAEAVERTALRTRYDLKDGAGPADLLEYFRMAAEGIALDEAGASPPDDFLGEFSELRERVRPYFQRG